MLSTDLCSVGFHAASSHRAALLTDRFVRQMLEAVLNVANSRARIPCCGMISQYNVQDKEGIRNMFMVSLLYSLDVLYHTDRLLLYQCCAMCPDLAALGARLWPGAAFAHAPL